MKEILLPCPRCNQEIELDANYDFFCHSCGCHSVLGEKKEPLGVALWKFKPEQHLKLVSVPLNDLKDIELFKSWCNTFIEYLSKASYKVFKDGNIEEIILV